MDELHCYNSSLWFALSLTLSPRGEKMAIIHTKHSCPEKPMHHFVRVVNWRQDFPVVASQYYSKGERPVS